jgi:hypothetical protein
VVEAEVCDRLQALLRVVVVVVAEVEVAVAAVEMVV